MAVIIYNFASKNILCHADRVWNQQNDYYKNSLLELQTHIFLETCTVRNIRLNHIHKKAADE